MTVAIPERTIWLDDDGWAVCVIDQTRLPHEFAVARLEMADDAERAIRSMVVRGAPLIGATAAYGMALALRDDPTDRSLTEARERLLATRPTAVNLRWALDRVRHAVTAVAESDRAAVAYRLAAEICDEDAAICSAIGDHGVEILLAAWHERDRPSTINVLTHCNAGRLATVEWGTATAPIYKAHEAGIPVHVWVDETRPRNQGAGLTAWELAARGVPHTVIVDNAGGHLMQHGRVDLCLVGSDRTTANGDVANKIGTYLKALAAHDNGVPFYVALPSPTIDWTLRDGTQIPIEERDPAEVTTVQGRDPGGSVRSVQVTPEGTPVANYGFDVTPGRLVTGLITERGVTEASASGLAALFPGAGVNDAAAVVAAARQMNAAGINRGMAGNVSVRTAGGFLITPSAVPYERLDPGAVVAMAMSGEAGAGVPSSEWRIHRDLYVARRDVAAVVHAHPPFATALACLRREIPPFHYMVAVAGGATIRCAPYAAFGTQVLADHVAAALEGRRACLLANHGLVATGPGLEAALRLAIEVESLAEMYWRALQIGEPELLSAAQMAEALAKFQTYGRPSDEGSNQENEDGR